MCVHPRVPRERTAIVLWCGHPRVPRERTANASILCQYHGTGARCRSAQRSASGTKKDGRQWQVKPRSCSRRRRPTCVATASTASYPWRSDAPLREASPRPYTTQATPPTHPIWSQPQPTCQLCPRALENCGPHLQGMPLLHCRMAPCDIMDG